MVTILAFYNGSENIDAQYIAAQFPELNQKTEDLGKDISRAITATDSDGKLSFDDYEGA